MPHNLNSPGDDNELGRSTTTTPSSLEGVPPSVARHRRREWNRGPVRDLFPRIPAAALEKVLDVLIDKGFTYNLSEAKRWNARRYTSMIVAHVRHTYSDYDKLLNSEERLERFEARKRTGPQVWKVLKEWCPWEDSNDVLERCFKATLVRPEERGLDWDPMDIDSESEDENHGHGGDDDPMDLD